MTAFGGRGGRPDGRKSMGGMMNETQNGEASGENTVEKAGNRSNSRPGGRPQRGPFGERRPFGGNKFRGRFPGFPPRFQNSFSPCILPTNYILPRKPFVVNSYNYVDYSYLRRIPPFTANKFGLPWGRN